MQPPSTLTSVSVGALIAIVAAYVQNLFKQSADHLALRRGKLEQYVGALNKTYAVGLHHSQDQLEQQHEMLGVCAEILMLTNLYLPELASSGLKFVEVGQLYMLASRKYYDSAQTEEDAQAFELSRQEAQRTYQHAIDNATLLAARLKLRRRFLPLPKVDRPPSEVKYPL